MVRMRIRSRFTRRYFGPCMFATQREIWGLGTSLVAAVLDHARGRVEMVQLTVVSENEGARRLYRALGFVEYGYEKRALKQGGRYYDEVLMVKFLDEGLKLEHHERGRER